MCDRDGIFNKTYRCAMSCIKHPLWNLFQHRISGASVTCRNMRCLRGLRMLYESRWFAHINDAMDSRSGEVQTRIHGLSTGDCINHRRSTKVVLLCSSAFRGKQRYAKKMDANCSTICARALSPGRRCRFLRTRYKPGFPRRIRLTQSRYAS